MTDTKIQDRSYKLNKVLRKIREMQDENARLDQTIVELQNSVAERQNIWRIRRTFKAIVLAYDYHMRLSHGGYQKFCVHLCLYVSVSGCVYLCMLCVRCCVLCFL